MLVKKSDGYGCAGEEKARKNEAKVDGGENQT